MTYSNHKNDPNAFLAEHPIIEIKKGDIWAKFISTEKLNPEITTRLWTILDSGEKTRINRLISSKRKEESILAHALLRNLVSTIFSIDNNLLKFTENELTGKPKLTAKDRLTGENNLTHCCGLVGGVASVRHMVGIDAENTRNDIQTYSHLSLLADEERQWIMSHTNTVKFPFLYIWTLKEAILKALGYGISYDLSSFAVLPFPPRVVRMPRFFGEACNWLVWQDTLDDETIVAVAAYKP